MSSTQRKVTPSKIVEWARSGGSNGNSRTVTPQQTRSTSASRYDATSQGGLRAQESEQPPRIRHPSRSDSRRRQRKWENSHLISMVEHYANQGEEKIREIFDLDNEQESLQELLHASRYNTLSELLKPENRSMLQAFLSCQPTESKQSYPSNHASQKKSTLLREFLKQLNNSRDSSNNTATTANSSSPSNKIEQYSGATEEHHKTQAGYAMELEHFVSAELCWCHIEKKARTAVMKAHRLGDGSKALLRAIEQCVFTFIANSWNSPLIEDVDTQQENVETGGLKLKLESLSPTEAAVLEDVLAGPLRLDSARNLTVPFKDSSFHRLLFHGIAQFYGAHSHSTRVVTYLDCPGKKIQHPTKVCVLVKPQKLPQHLQSTFSRYDEARHSMIQMDKTVASSSNSSSSCGTVGDAYGRGMRPPNSISLTKFLLQLNNTSRNPVASITSTSTRTSTSAPASAPTTDLPVLTTAAIDSSTSRNPSSDPSNLDMLARAVQHDVDDAQRECSDAVDTHSDSREASTAYTTTSSSSDPLEDFVLV